MQIGLCMVVKDEERRIVECLEPIHDLFAQIVVADTGSTDATPQLLAGRFGIEPLRRPLDPSRCACLCDARNDAMATMTTPWVMFLDADERIDRDRLRRLVAMDDDPSQAGYFGRWVNHVAGEPTFDDYKLFVFRRELRSLGLVHDVVQHDIRFRGRTAAWLDTLSVDHFPDPARHADKAASYRRRLRCAIEQDPQFLRYHWFLGYTEFLAARHDDAKRHLGIAADACSRGFPVECLNSAMVLAELLARQGEAGAVERTLARAREFHRSVADDFEVRINWRLRPWLDDALAACRSGRLDSIRAYRFAC